MPGSFDSREDYMQRRGRPPTGVGDEGGGGAEVTFRVASFRYDQETSVEYKKFLTLKGLQKHIEHLVRDTQVDYVSLRLIRE